MKPRRFHALPAVFALLAFVVTFFSSGVASADVVTDEGAFSVDLSAARICFVIPLALRNPDDCQGLAPELVPVPKVDDTSRPVAVGLVHLEEPGEPIDLAVVTVTHVSAWGTFEPDAAGAREYETGVVGSIEKEIPSGARLRAPSDVRVIKPGALSLIRGVFSVDGIPVGNDKKLVERQVHVAAFTDDGGYAVIWLGKHESAARLEKLADAAAPTLALAHPAPSRSKHDPAKVGEVVGRIIGMVFVLLFMGVGAIIVWAVSSGRNGGRTYVNLSSQPYGPYGPPAGFGPQGGHPYAPPGAPSPYGSPAAHPYGQAPGPYASQTPHPPAFQMPPSPAPAPPPAVAPPASRPWWEQNR